MYGGLAAHSPWPAGWHSQGAPTAEEQVDAGSKEAEVKCHKMLPREHTHHISFPSAWGGTTSELRPGTYLPPEGQGQVWFTR